MAEVRPLDPNLRQQLAAMLAGDSKAGSIRANLVHGLLGSQTGEDSGLVGMTPMGAVFDMDAANRDKRQGGSGLGHTLSAAAGLIPGAGPEAHAIESLVEHPISVDFLRKVADDHAKIAEAEKKTIHYSDDGYDYYQAAKQLAKKFLGFENKGDVEGAAKFLNTPGALSDYASDGVSPLLHKFPASGFNDEPLEKGMMKAVAVRHDPIADPGMEAAPSTGVVGPRSIRAHLEAASKGDDKGATAIHPEDAEFNARMEDAQFNEGYSKAQRLQTEKNKPASVDGMKTSISDAASVRDPNAPGRAGQIDSHIADIEENAYDKNGISSPAKSEIKSVHPNMEKHIAEVAGGDAQKLNFIKNAMEDEGGNVPEEVAATLLDHVKQKGITINGVHKPESLFPLKEAIKARTGSMITTPNEQENESYLIDQLSNNFSIPEMLSMHYDTDPKTMGAAYKAPGPKNRPTQ